MASYRELTNMLAAMCRLIRAGSRISPDGATMFRAAALLASVKSGDTEELPWTPFIPSTPLGYGGYSECYVNSRYQVHVRPLPRESMVHLSIKRIDQAPVHRWRDLQRIKDDLVGPECEGIELYPSRSRLVDEANQFHLWVYTDPKHRIALGDRVRQISTPEEAALVGARQEPFEEDVSYVA